MVEQQVIEDITHTSFEEAGETWLLGPLHMTRSTFASPLPTSTNNVAKAHDDDGRQVAQPRGWQTFPEQAASGLWTSARELGTFVAALIDSYRGRSDFLPRELATSYERDTGRPMLRYGRGSDLKKQR